MDNTALLQEFENLAERLSIQIKYGNLGRNGGLCRYREAYHIIVNKRLDTEGRIAVFARAFANFPLDDVFVIPAIREAIETYRNDDGDTDLISEDEIPEDTDLENA